MAVIRCVMKLLLEMCLEKKNPGSYKLPGVELLSSAVHLCRHTRDIGALEPPTLRSIFQA